MEPSPDTGGVVCNVVGVIVGQGTHEYRKVQVFLGDRRNGEGPFFDPNRVLGLLLKTKMLTGLRKFRAPPKTRIRKNLFQE